MASPCIRRQKSNLPLHYRENRSFARSRQRHCHRRTSRIWVDEWRTAAFRDVWHWNRSRRCIQRWDHRGNGRSESIIG